MDDEDSYQIMPYKEIVALRKEIDSLKTKNDDSSFQALLNSMSTLTKSMNSMLELFRTAAEEMKLEGKSEMGVAKEIGPLTEKMNTLMDQNKTIAEGLLAISDMVKEFKEKGPQAGPAPVFRLQPRRAPMPPPMRPQSPFEEVPPFPPGAAPPMPPGQMQPPFPPGQMPPLGLAPPPGAAPGLVPPSLPNSDVFPPPGMPGQPPKKKSKFLGLIKK